MTAWKRWQDYATMAFGVLLFISPLVFAETTHQVATVSAYVLGVLLFLSGILAASNREGRSSPILNAPGIVAVVTFVAPFVLGFAGITGIAWTAWVLAIATVLVGATVRFGRRTGMKIARNV
jgi:VIT1/CCC1 family predicted Fe2+/Mn2+ transporter